MDSQAQFPFNQEVVWRPSEEYVGRSRLKRFMERHGLATFEELMARSTSDIAWFWDAVFEDLGVEFYEPYTQVVDLSGGIQWPKWCVGAKLNIVHNCLDKWMGTPTQNRVAVRWEGEEGTIRLLTYRDLYREVNRVASALRAAGLGKGDAVGLYMPMTPEIVIALLAIAKIGGVILPLFSGYGPGAITARLADAEAKALFTADGVSRRGKTILMKPIADEALKDVPSLEKVIVQRRVGADVPMTAGRDVWWDDFVAGQPAHRGRRPDHDHLHQRHHRAAQGRGAHPLRLSHQERPGHGPRL
jgi:acetyl-CoA synthetase